MTILQTDDLPNDSSFDVAEFFLKMKYYALKMGRKAARPVLLLYYVMQSEETPQKDKAIIVGALAYLFLPIDLLKAKHLPILGWLDEIAPISLAYKRVSKYITPEMEAKADAQLDAWFGGDPDNITMPDWVDY